MKFLWVSSRVCHTLNEITVINIRCAQRGRSVLGWSKTAWSASQRGRAWPQMTEASATRFSFFWLQRRKTPHVCDQDLGSGEAGVGLGYFCALWPAEDDAPEQPEHFVQAQRLKDCTYSFFICFLYFMRNLPEQDCRKKLKLPQKSVIL